MTKSTAIGTVGVFLNVLETWYVPVLKVNYYKDSVNSYIANSYSKLTFFNTVAKRGTNNSGVGLSPLVATHSTPHGARVTHFNSPLQFRTATSQSGVSITARV